MVTNEEIILYKDLSYRIVGLAMRVHSGLGHGFLEKVYERALMVLLRRENIAAEQQAPITVTFEGEVVGNYYAAILVENKIIDAHRAQALHYLKATGLRLAIILNSGKEKLEYERIIK
jgi:GxxExxY protein